jgi:hypothetical protein
MTYTNCDLTTARCNSLLSTMPAEPIHSLITKKVTVMVRPIMFK